MEGVILIQKKRPTEVSLLNCRINDRQQGYDPTVTLKSDDTVPL